MSSLPLRIEAPLRPAVAWSRVLAHRLALPLLFAGAALYHGLWSLGHRTPLVFSDELLYSKLAQSIASGDGLSIWGERYFFPAPLAPLLQAPVWLLDSDSAAYLLARLENALFMASAVLPAYWLARRLVRREWALLTAASAVALPALGYHDALMAEALAYPLFLWGAAVIVRAVADGGRLRWLVPVVCALAVGARIQLVLLPVAYAVAVAVAAPRRRAHLGPLAALALPGLAAFAARGTGAVGQYDGVFHLGLTAGGVVHYALLVALLLPFSIGLAVAPGALLGLLGRPRDRAELAFLAVAVVSLLGMLAQSGVLAAGEAQRPLERYAFYVSPLLMLAFFLYVERGAPRRLLYVTLAIAGGLAAARLPFSELAPVGSLYFDAPSATVFASIQGRLGAPNGTLVIELTALLVGLVVALLPAKRAGAAAVTALVALTLAGFGGVAYYRADHSTTRWVVDRFAWGELDWIDRSGLGPVTYLSLPQGQLIPDGTLEVWNRDVVRVAEMTDKHAGVLPVATARVSPAGRLLVDGRPNAAGRYVLGAFGSRIGIDGDVVGRSGWLTAVDLARGARVRWLLAGMQRDGNSQSLLVYRVWPDAGATRGRFTLRLSLPRDREAKAVTAWTDDVTQRSVTLRPGASARLVVPAPTARIPMLHLSVRLADGTGDSFTRRGVHVDRIVWSRERG